MRAVCNWHYNRYFKALCYIHSVKGKQSFISTLKIYVLWQSCCIISTLRVFFLFFFWKMQSVIFDTFVVNMPRHLMSPEWEFPFRILGKPPLDDASWSHRTYLYDAHFNPAANIVHCTISLNSPMWNMIEIINCCFLIAAFNNTHAMMHVHTHLSVRACCSVCHFPYKIDCSYCSKQLASLIPITKHSQ